jgi:hypothetical protein
LIQFLNFSQFLHVAAPASSTYYSSIPTEFDFANTRKIDPNRLREIRKKLDGGNFTYEDIEQIASECIDDIVELCTGKPTLRLNDGI